MTALLYGLSGLFMLTGVYLLFLPMHFYENVPGVAGMGAFNLHFIMDAGLAFLASGALVFWGTRRKNAALIMAGALWPSLHAILHLQMWVMRGFVLDVVAFSDFFGLVLPAALTMWAGWKLKGTIQ